MNQYEITTAQNVTLKYTIANMGDRILAALIDLFILLGYIILAAYIFNKLENARGFNVNYWAYLVITLPAYFYSLLFEFFMNGQTPGKRLRKIKVVRTDGKSLTFGSCVIRWLFRLVDIWFDSGSVAIVTATFSKIHQRVGDMVAGTIVISTRETVNNGIAKYADLNTQGPVMLTQVERLSVHDIEIVNEALGLYYELDEFDYILLVSAQLKRVLDIMPEMDDLAFVKRVVTDYNLINSVPEAG